MYRNLKAEMARNGVTIRKLADSLGVRYATISDKINGKSRFYLDEARFIKHHFFPNCSIEYLFEESKSEEQNTA